MERSLFISTVAMTPLKWFFAQLFPSISSVSTEQWHICAKNYPKIQKLQGNLQQMKLLESMDLQNFLVLILIPMLSCREICCKKMNKNSNNLLKIRNCPNCATTLVWRLLKEDNSFFLLLKKKDQMMICNIYVEGTRYLEVTKHPEQEGGSVDTRRSVPSLDVKVCFHGVEIRVESLFRDKTDSWVRIVNGIHQYVTRNVRNHSYWKRWAQGNLLQSCYQGLLWHCLLLLFLSVKENGEKLSLKDSIKIVWQCQKRWSDHCDMKLEKSLRRWCSTIWRHLERIQGKVQRCFAG